jgi:hypothetical protein
METPRSNLLYTSSHPVLHAWLLSPMQVDVSVVLQSMLLLLLQLLLLQEATQSI